MAIVDIVSAFRNVSTESDQAQLAEDLGNVSHACKVMGYSWDTFYRYRQAVEEGGFEALIEKSRRKPNLQNRTRRPRRPSWRRPSTNRRWAKCG